MARELHKKKNKELYAIYSQEPKIKKINRTISANRIIRES